MFGTGRIERIVADPTHRLLARLGELPRDPRRVIWMHHGQILRHETENGRGWYRAPSGRGSVGGRYFVADGERDTIIVAQEMPPATAATYTFLVAVSYLTSLAYLVGAASERRADLVFDALVAATVIRLFVAWVRWFEWLRFLHGLGQLGWSRL
jgi:hypothetical protein